MATYREIVYMALDELKLFSGDSYYTPEHLIFLAGHYRSLLLERRYRDVRRGDIPHINYQELCFDLEEVPAIPGTDCYGTYLKSTSKVPTMMNIGMRRIYPVDYFNSEMFTWVSRERMQFVGNNKWLQNIIYVTKGTDDYLYLKSENPQFLYLKQIKLDAIFFNAREAAELECNRKDSGNCDILDSDFPIEESLVTPLIQLMVNELNGNRYMPTDQENDAHDNMAGMMGATPKNVKPAQTDTE